MIDEIFLIKSRPGIGLNDKYVISCLDHTFFETGPDEMVIDRWLDKFFGKGFPHHARMFEFLSGVGIRYLSDVIWKNGGVGRGFCWKIIKNRTAFAGEPPFSSLEEARLRCAVLGWPEPKLICDGRPRPAEGAAKSQA